MKKQRPPRHDPFRRLRLALRLTWTGMLAERVTRSFWPLWSIVFGVCAALMLGLHDLAPLEVVWSAAVISVLGALTALGWGIWKFRLPRGEEAEDRLDRSEDTTGTVREPQSSPS